MPGKGGGDLRSVCELELPHRLCPEQKTAQSLIPSTAHVWLRAQNPEAGAEQRAGEPLTRRLLTYLLADPRGWRQPSK
ncbi:hypothetical protein LEMLEM_LOCUS18786 [Lemmus lemmus]